jgi:cell division protein FtsQ
MSARQVRRGSDVRSARRPARVITPASRRPKRSLGAQFGKMMESLPVPRALVRRVRNWTLGLLISGGIVAGLVAMGVPGMIGMEMAHGLGRMGFVVRTIEISGREHVDRDQVYGIVMDARGQDMPLVDLAATRQKLLAIGWVGDARVSRRLPDTLVVDIVERKPAAILQRNQQLSLIDATGRVLAPVDPRTMPVQLPLVIGPGAETQIGALEALIASQPTMKTLIEGGTWVGQRRWDLRFQSGEVLALPEGDAAARDALARFAKKDSEARLLGQGYVRIDMRDPAHMIVRTSSEPGTRIADAPPGGVA